MTDRLRFGTRTGGRASLRAEVDVQERTAGVATIRLYDPIDSYGGYWGVSAKELAAVLDDLPDGTTEISLLVNSPGGEITEGLAMLNLLRAHPARVVATVEGLAASAASFLLMAADEVLVAPNSEVMIHEGWGVCVGPAADMTKMAADLDHLSANIASAYAAKAGGTVDQWRAVMRAETWFGADEAVAAGLADRVLPTARDAEPAKARWDVSAMRAQVPTDSPAVLAGDPAAAGSTTRKESLVDTLIAGLRERLGFAEDADEATILGAVDEALTESAEPQARTNPEGTTLIDTSALSTLQAQAARGEQARVQQEAEGRDRLVAAAVEDGRIPAVRAKAWAQMLTADPGAAEALAALPAGIAVPLTELGVGNGPEQSEMDALYASLYTPTKAV